MIKTTPEGETTVDLISLAGLMGLAARRVSAFARLALDGVDERGTGDFNLSGALTTHRFWPDEISNEVRADTRNNYRQWIFGSALRELDACMTLFLDNVWWSIEVAENQGVENFQFDLKFANRTNVAEKAGLVRDKLGNPDQTDYLERLSRARNALAHGAGHVLPRYCSDAAKTVLELKWLGYDPHVTVGDVTTAITSWPHEIDGPAGSTATFNLKIVERSSAYPLGTKIEITEAQLAELCLYYQIISAQVMDKLQALYIDKGLLIIVPPVDAKAAPEVARSS